MAFVEVAANSASGAYDIANSGRFGGVETFLTKSQSDNESDTDRRKFTVSGWYKQTLQGSAGGWNGLWSAMVDSNNFTSLKINADKELIFDLNISGTNKSFTTDKLFRDPAAWYHIVVAYDSTDGTAADRLKIYVNGEKQTGTFSADITQNDPAHWGDDASAARVGAYGNNTGNAYMHNGYMADVCMTVGYALAPAQFGENDEDSGIWKPKKPSVTYSANGFFLEFKQTGTSQNSSGIGADTSGNDNHFAIDSDNTELDSTTDTPTNNFATLNPLNPTQGGFTEGNLAFKNALNSSPHHGLANGTIAIANGKWYWEVRVDAVGGTAMSIGAIEVTEFAKNDFTGDNGVGYFNNGNFHYRGTEDSNPNTYTTNDIIGIALDMDNRGIYFHKNGTYEISGDPTSGASRTGSAGGALHASNVTMVPAVSNYDSGACNVNFGNPNFSISSGNADANGYGNFEYAVPANYYALCTKNLAEYG